MLEMLNIFYNSGKYFVLWLNDFDEVKEICKTSHFLEVGMLFSFGMSEKKSENLLLTGIKNTPQNP